ncbi:hypothetical protein LV164_006704 [Aspergillus fumigatus]|nr:hypothetical protein KXX42_003554 [Aspergillus fumigatus]KAH1546188.1 hypothetical protein KXX57_003980 [Aspergillus fumigatus]KAH1985321.1 hypothetical protein KXW88_000253 [Aspergillus fumigatus]KAH2316667.1 hypothetical protein KXV47_000791 [Aspergillus fumigatus]KAH2664234.1 hypothetical protein KXV32_007988 [Aspergillus fumigatus]
MASNSSDQPSAPLETVPRSITLHVLCPSLPNRFTFDDLPLSTTVAGLKARLTESIPSRPAPSNQRLIWRGRALLDDAMTLESVLDPADSTEYSMHLALPPPSTVGSARTSTPSASEAPPTGRLPDPFLNRAWSSALPTLPTSTQSFRQRGPIPPGVPHEAEIGLALQRNIDQIHRQIRTAAQQPRSGPQGVATSTSSVDQAGAQQRTGVFQSGYPPATWSTRVHGPLGLPDLPQPQTSSTGTQATNLRARLDVLQLQVNYAEDQLQLGIAPPAERIIRIRNQLCEMLDDLYSDPRAARNGNIEALLARVFNIYTRADQLRVTQSRLQPTLATNASANAEPAQPPLYLLSSPGGYQALVASPGATNSIQALVASFHVSQTPEFTPIQAPAQPARFRANQEAVVLENVVRQAVLNQRAVNNGPVDLSRYIRRIWLFVRLYFFCYMFSEPGTWLRVLYVSLAVIASLLSETNIPRQLFNLTVAPLQRYLEGLLHVAPDAAGNNGTRAAVNGTGMLNDNRASLPGQLRQGIQRLERSAALFVASLVPGVGERQIEVRNAAEAARNAQLAREEEERRRQQETAGNGENSAERQEPREEADGANERVEPAEQNIMTTNQSEPLIPLEPDE